MPNSSESIIMHVFESKEFIFYINQNKTQYLHHPTAMNTREKELNKSKHNAV